MRAASASAVVLAALVATVALASALRPLAGPRGGAQAFAGHNKGRVGAADLLAVAVTVFRPPGLVQLARTAGPRHGSAAGP